MPENERDLPLLLPLGEKREKKKKRLNTWLLLRSIVSIGCNFQISEARNESESLLRIFPKDCLFKSSRAKKFFPSRMGMRKKGWMVKVEEKNEWMGRISLLQRSRIRARN